MFGMSQELRHILRLLKHHTHSSLGSKIVIDRDNPPCTEGLHHVQSKLTRKKNIFLIMWKPVYSHYSINKTVTLIFPITVYNYNHYTYIQ